MATQRNQGWLRHLDHEISFLEIYNKKSPVKTGF